MSAIRVKCGEIGTMVTRTSSVTRGMSAVTMVSTTFCSCRILLCLRLCRSAVGADVGSLVRKTAVPGTMCGGFFSRLRTSVSSGTSPRRVLLASSVVPRRQVMISSTMVIPNRSGTHAPSSSLRRLAERKMLSIATSGMISSAACHHGHRHSRQMTMKPSRPSITMVVLTAMP